MKPIRVGVECFVCNGVYEATVHSVQGPVSPSRCTTVEILVPEALKMEDGKYLCIQECLKQYCDAVEEADRIREKTLLSLCKKKPEKSEEPKKSEEPEEPSKSEEPEELQNGKRGKRSKRKNK